MEVSEDLARAIKKNCKLFSVQSLVKVNHYCKKAGLKNSTCKKCERLTPTITTAKIKECAICTEKK